MISSVNRSTPEFQKYQHQFVDYLRNPLKNGAIPESLPQRSGIYAKLLFGKIENSLNNCFPISRQLLGSTCWKHLIQAFIKNHRCNSPLYREIPDEFIAYLMVEKSPMALPKFIIELMHFEWMELVLETEKPVLSRQIMPVKPDKLTDIPVLNPVLHLLHYHYPVQNITAYDLHWNSWSSRLVSYPREAIILAGLRNGDDIVHFIELNAVTARLIELMQEGLYSGKQALLELAAEMHYKDHKSILPSGIKILQQLEQQQIIIGAH